MSRLTLAAALALWAVGCATVTVERYAGEPTFVGGVLMRCQTGREETWHYEEPEVCSRSLPVQVVDQAGAPVQGAKVGAARCVVSAPNTSAMWVTQYVQRPTLTDAAGQTRACVPGALHPPGFFSDSAWRSSGELVACHEGSSARLSGPFGDGPVVLRLTADAGQ